MYIVHAKERKPVTKCTCACIDQHDHLVVGFTDALFNDRHEARILERSSDTLLVVHLLVDCVAHERFSSGGFEARAQGDVLSASVECLPGVTIMSSCVAKDAVSGHEQVRHCGNSARTLNGRSRTRVSFSRKHRPMSVASEQCGTVGVNSTRMRQSSPSSTTST